MEILVGLFVLASIAVGFLLAMTALVLVVVLVIRGARATGAPLQPATAPAPGPLAGLARWWSSGNLLTSGTPARAILLWVDSMGTRTSFCGVRCELRRAYVDVEMRGMPPFEVQADVYIPTTLVRDALPGATVEARIDPNRPSRLMIVGPDVGYAQAALRTS